MDAKTELKNDNVYINSTAVVSSLRGIYLYTNIHVLIYSRLIKFLNTIIRDTNSQLFLLNLLQWFPWNWLNTLEIHGPQKGDYSGHGLYAHTNNGAIHSFLVEENSE